MGILFLVTVGLILLGLISCVIGSVLLCRGGNRWLPFIIASLVIEMVAVICAFTGLMNAVTHAV